MPSPSHLRFCNPRRSVRCAPNSHLKSPLLNVSGRYGARLAPEDSGSAVKTILLRSLMARALVPVCALWHHDSIDRRGCLCRRPRWRTAEESLLVEECPAAQLKPWRVDSGDARSCSPLGKRRRLCGVASRPGRKAFAETETGTLWRPHGSSCHSARRRQRAVATIGTLELRLSTSRNHAACRRGGRSSASG
jgi:hypothetical protein